METNDLKIRIIPLPFNGVNILQLKIVKIDRLYYISTSYSHTAGHTIFFAKEDLGEIIEIAKNYKPKIYYSLKRNTDIIDGSHQFNGRIGLSFYIADGDTVKDLSYIEISDEDDLLYEIEDCCDTNGFDFYNYEWIEI